MSNNGPDQKLKTGGKPKGLAFAKQLILIKTIDINHFCNIDMQCIICRRDENQGNRNWQKKLSK